MARSACRSIIGLRRGSDPVLRLRNRALVDRGQGSRLGGRLCDDVEVTAGPQSHDGVPVWPGSPHCPWHMLDDHGANVIAGVVIQDRAASRFGCPGVGETVQRCQAAWSVVEVEVVVASPGAQAGTQSQELQELGRICRAIRSPDNERTSGDPMSWSGQPPTPPLPHAVRVAQPERWVRGSRIQPPAAPPVRRSPTGRRSCFGTATSRWARGILGR